MRLELDDTFIRRTDLAFDADDLRLGVSLGLISPATAVTLAADAAASGATQSSDVTPQAPPPSQPLPKNPNSTPPPPKPTKE